jgi:hypothetical protein
MSRRSFDTDVLLQLLVLITRQVRAMTLGQLARWAAWHQRPQSLDKLLASVERQGLICRHRVLARIPRVSQPTAVGRPSACQPTPHSLAWEFELRLRETQPCAYTIFHASTRAAKCTGGVGGPLRHPLQVEHDLLVSEVFLCRAQLDTSTSRAWVGEDVYRRDFASSVRGPLPDAVLVDTAGVPFRAIEVGGQYTARRIDRALTRSALPLEVW